MNIGKSDQFIAGCSFIESWLRVFKVLILALLLIVLPAMLTVVFPAVLKL